MTIKKNEKGNMKKVQHAIGCIFNEENKTLLEEINKSVKLCGCYISGGYIDNDSLYLGFDSIRMQSSSMPIHSIKKLIDRHLIISDGKVIIDGYVCE